MNEKAFAQIERADPLVEVALKQITTAIVSGRLEPGDQLVEAQVADQLGVSRGTVREAIGRLEQIGLVEKIPYRGAFVSELTKRDIEELHTVRWALEGLAARLLADRHDSEVVATLENLLEQMRTAAAADEQTAIINLDADFHDTLIELTAHKLLNEMWVTASVQLRRFLLLKRERLYDQLPQAAELHEPIVQAIAEGDPNRAELEARRHIREAGQNLGSEWSSVSFAWADAGGDA